MSQNPQPKPVKNWTPQDWVDHYYDIEKQVSEGKTVRYDGGQGTVEHTFDDLSEIRAARNSWQRRLARESGKVKTAGGIGYSAVGFK